MEYINDLAEEDEINDLAEEDERVKGMKAQNSELWGEGTKKSKDARSKKAEATKKILEIWGEDEVRKRFAHALNRGGDTLSKLRRRHTVKAEEAGGGTPEVGCCYATDSRRSLVESLAPSSRARQQDTDTNGTRLRCGDE